MNEQKPTVFLLSSFDIPNWCERVGIPRAMADVLCAVRDNVETTPSWKELYGTLWEQFGSVGNWHGIAPGGEPNAEIQALSGERAWAFTLLLHLNALPEVENLYLQHGIPSEVFSATMADIGVWARNGTDKAGAPWFSEFGWIRNHLGFRLFRLGRLQFIRMPYEGKTLFLRNACGTTVVLAEAGLSIRADGYLNGNDGVEEANCWTTRLERNAEGWNGHPVAPDGRVSPEPCPLSAEEWTPCLSSGDWMLDVHIPQGERLDISACMESFSLAVPFFNRLVPQAHHHAFRCNSWLLAPQLPRIAGEEANVSRFGRLFHRIPSGGDREQAWNRIFGNHAPSLETAPQDSSLQRAFHAWLSDGRLFFGQEGIRLLEGSARV